MGKLREDRRPMRDLLLLLPLLQVTPAMEIDYAAADPNLLAQIAENADISMRTIHLGLSAVGSLLAHSAPEVETGDISANVIEALGWCMAELGEFAAIANNLSTACRRHNADYAPHTAQTVPNVRV